VKEFVKTAFQYANLDWHDYVIIDPLYYRPTEVDCLRAEPAKARKQLGWRHTVGFEELVRILVDAELHALQAPANGSRVEARPVVASNSET
jgi:GDPmannose 4,6-dehydratase